jgi:hypothetical protein
MLTSSQPLVVEIFASLRVRYANLNRHYEAAWTESWCHRRCEHFHETLIDAAKCAEKQGQPGWYCFAVEFDQPRQLNPQEEWDVHEFKFGPKAHQEPSLFREDTNGNE